VAGTDELDRWWDGLTEEQRAEAIRSRDAGQLNEGLQRSLENAGLVEPGVRPDRSIPGDVFSYLKMRH
jgi:hypothetical protein